MATGTLAASATETLTMVSMVILRASGSGYEHNYGNRSELSCLSWSECSLYSVVQVLATLFL